jgi:hypothetical protein
MSIFHLKRVALIECDAQLKRLSVHLHRLHPAVEREENTGQSVSPETRSRLEGIYQQFLAVKCLFLGGLDGRRSIDPALIATFGLVLSGYPYSTRTIAAENELGPVPVGELITRTSYPDRPCVPFSEAIRELGDFFLLLEKKICLILGASPSVTSCPPPDTIRSHESRIPTNRFIELPTRDRTVVKSLLVVGPKPSHLIALVRAKASSPVTLLVVDSTGNVLGQSQEIGGQPETVTIYLDLAKANPVGNWEIQAQTNRPSSWLCLEDAVLRHESIISKK